MAGDWGKGRWGMRRGPSWGMAQRNGLMQTPMRDLLRDVMMCVMQHVMTHGLQRVMQRMMQSTMQARCVVVQLVRWSAAPAPSPPSPPPVGGRTAAEGLGTCGKRNH